MKVAINTLAFDRGGAITHMNNILPYLAETDNEYLVIVPAGRDEIDRLNAVNISYRVVSFPTDDLIARFTYEQLFLPFVLFYHDIDVLYSPTGITTFLAPCKIVTTVRNIKPHLSREKRSTGKRVKYRIQRWLTRLSARRGDRVIFVSEYTKNTVQPYLGIDNQKCSIVYHGIEPSAFENPSEPAAELKTKVDEQQPYVVYVSTLYKHKNHETLIKAYANLSINIREEYPLLLVGGCPNEEYGSSLRELVESLGIADDVHFVGRVAHTDVPYIFANASVSVMPSKLETFGIPIVEAMAAGTPVIASDAAAMPEVAGDAALLFKPDDTTELTSMLERVLTDDQLASELAAASQERANEFSWRRTAEETYAVIRAVHHRK